MRWASTVLWRYINDSARRSTRLPSCGDCAERLAKKWLCVRVIFPIGNKGRRACGSSRDPADKTCGGRRRAEWLWRDLHRRYKQQQAGRSWPGRRGERQVPIRAAFQLRETSFRWRADERAQRWLQGRWDFRLRTRRYAASAASLPPVADSASSADMSVSAGVSGRKRQRSEQFIAALSLG